MYNVYSNSTGEIDSTPGVYKTNSFFKWDTHLFTNCFPKTVNNTPAQPKIVRNMQNVKEMSRDSP